ncbi:DUF4411 family protein [Rhodospirillum centenum]|uniref:PIN domain protein n=1 Tax=Rhodospirillum centenum (strain ATCC 51521 / SW) TaxID=414684 RepID=B6IW29_RHOCS|nr:DUF4411 family protein [Rhodospirillum centenum]ACJ00503.1 conserved hypothetical protein [Rhodospirillum centenum SW]
MFLTDANVFIEAKNRYYDFDICPGFWDWMDAQVPEMKVCSIKPVYDELAGGGDSLSRWVKDRRADGRFLKVDDVAAQTFFARVAATVQAGAFKPEAKAQFLSGADPWLVAKAGAIGATVVTQEKYQAGAQRRVPLPNICQAFGVPYIDTFELLKQGAAKFRIAV